MKLNPTLLQYIDEQVLPATLRLTPERKAALEPLIAYLKQELATANPPRLVFICTHNSRRSHLSQIWASTAAAYYGIQVETYSGGTEATAFNPRAVRAVEQAGFGIENPGGENPRYIVTAGDTLKLEAFSKRFDDEANPTADFAAVMTCSDADEACPFVPGASQRIRLLYNDPKEADDTPQEQERYAERCLQIASELFYAFQKVSNKQ
ncbi:low molecular weight phosphatase family protein [Marinoscillum furvescens]|nr:protein-tyrosine-phosphatase [Marinoscillum furvescens]